MNRGRLSFRGSRSFCHRRIWQSNKLQSMRRVISRTHRSCVELFRPVDWTQVCGISQGHSAGQLILQGDLRLVTWTFLALAFRVECRRCSNWRAAGRQMASRWASNGEPLGVSPRCTATPLAATGDAVVCHELQPDTPRPASLLLHVTPTNLHGGENGGRN